MDRSRLLVVRGVLALGLVLGAGGCSGNDPEPRVEPSRSGTPSASASASPEAMTPKQTVRAWVDAQNEALATGDTTRVRKLSAHPCRACHDFIDPIEQVYRDGGHFETDGWTVDSLTMRRERRTAVVVDAAVTIAGGSTVTTAGGSPVKYKTEKRIMLFRLDSGGDHWAISFVGFVS